MTDLAAIQTWVTRAVSGPDIPEGAAGLIRPSAALGADAQVVIYRRAYRARLIRCFREVFPGLEVVLGQAIFEAFVADFLERHPPSHPELQEETRAFPAFLAATRPGGPDDLWATLVVEIAEMERAWLDVAEGPGIEGAARPTAGDFFGQPTGRWLSCVPDPSPALRLFAHHFPTPALVEQARRGQAPDWPQAPAPTCFALVRERWQIRTHQLTPPQQTLLSALNGRASIREALGETGLRIETADLRTWLGQWASWGCFQRLSGSTSAAP